MDLKSLPIHDTTIKYIYVNTSLRWLLFSQITWLCMNWHLILEHVVENNIYFCLSHSIYIILDDGLIAFFYASHLCKIERGK